MTDMELAEEIERQLRLDGPYTITLAPNEWEQILAALRHADLAQTEIKGHMRVTKEVRDDALEEAAKVAEPKSNDPQGDWERGYWAAENVISKTIRSLKSHA